jgi:hypothetical protein
MASIHRSIDRRMMINLMLGLCLVGFTLWYWSGVASVPFHPDESTYLFMSADWETMLAKPTALEWQPNSKDPRQIYRLLDAPLSRYLVGFSRSLAGYLPMEVDWNWSQTWEQNRKAGALPDESLLTAGRLGEAALFPLSLLLIFQAGTRLGGRTLGCIAVVVLASSALALIHTRRAMAEGGTVFAVCLFLAGLVSWRKAPWLIALPAALAFCAKQSTFPLALVGAAAVLVYCAGSVSKWRLLGYLALYGLIFAGTVIAFNPFLWGHPIEAIRAAILARQDLLARQTLEFGLAAPDSVLGTPWLAGLSLLANQFIIPPAVADVGNYLAETNLAAQAYLANPFNILLRSLAGGGLMLVLSSAGFFLAAGEIKKRNTTVGIPWLLVGCAGLVQFLALALSVTLPIQRYVIPVVPFSCLWIGLSLTWMGRKLASIRLQGMR